MIQRPVLKHNRHSWKMKGRACSSSAPDTAFRIIAQSKSVIGHEQNRLILIAIFYVPGLQAIELFQASQIASEYRRPLKLSVEPPRNQSHGQQTLIELKIYANPPSLEIYKQRTCQHSPSRNATSVTVANGLFLLEFHTISSTAAMSSLVRGMG
jgi:hypothetical protein